MLYIFDIDGTLLDSINDIADSCNNALVRLGYKPCGIERYYSVMGKAIREFMRGILPIGASEEEITCLHQAYIENNDNTAPYDGIIELIDNLKKRGDRLAILSNKPDSAAKQVINRIFGDKFELTLGLCNLYKKKPSPEGIYYISEKLCVPITDMCYIGDVESDIVTSHNAGIPSVAVMWGYGNKAELLGAKPTFVVNKPEEILKIEF